MKKGLNIFLLFFIFICIIFPGFIGCSDSSSRDDGIEDDNDGPEINVKQDTTDIPSGTGSYNFGNVIADGEGGAVSEEITFTIENLGSNNLNIYSISISSGDIIDFVLTNNAATVVAPSETTTFSILFDPILNGTKIITLSIINNDIDEGTYNFNIIGTGDIWLHGIRYIDKGIDSAITVDENNMYISYYDNTNCDLKFAKSTDAGASWLSENIITVDNDGAVGLYSSIAVNGSNIHISYCDATNNDIKYAKSTNGGTIWTTMIVDSVSSYEEDTSIAVDEQNVYISYCRADGLNRSLKFAKSTDNGDTWPIESIRTIDNNAGYYNSMAVNGNKIYISYYDFTSQALLLAKSGDSGVSWDLFAVDDDPSDIIGEYTSIAIDDNYIYISYYDYTNNTLKFAKVTDIEDVLSVECLKELRASVGQTETSIAIDGNNIYIIYERAAMGLLLARSIDGGTNWSIDNMIASSGIRFSIEVNDSNVYISFASNEVYFAKSIDSGITW